jgi:WD40 repeat protein
MSAQSQSSLPRVNTSFLPVLLKGHEGSITTVKYNQDGDFIFTAALDHTPTVWYADSGERLGTYGYHRGAVSNNLADEEQNCLLI